MKQCNFKVGYYKYVETYKLGIIVIEHCETLEDAKEFKKGYKGKEDLFIFEQK